MKKRVRKYTRRLTVLSSPLSFVCHENRKTHARSVSDIKCVFNLFLRLFETFRGNKIFGELTLEIHPAELINRHVGCPLLSPDFNENRNLSKFNKTFQCEIS